MLDPLNPNMSIHGTLGRYWTTSKHSGTIVANSHMSLSTLTQKTAMLMALCTAGRGSELRAANIETMADMGTCIVFFR